MSFAPVACLLTAGALLVPAAPAAGQSYPFSRPLDARAARVLVVDTTRGRVEVIATDGSPVIEGVATVRLGWNVPADAPALARAAAETPPIALADGEVRLTYPADRRPRESVIFHWRVSVPPTMAVRVQTASGEVTLAGLGAPARVSSGSGAVSARGLRGGIDVDGRSGSVELVRITGDVGVRTDSGAVHVGMDGAGAVAVTTRSSSIEVDGAASGVRATSGSGAVSVAGTPAADWFLETRSSRIVLAPRGAPFRLDLRSRSGRVSSGRPGEESAPHAVVDGQDAAGALITARSGSGAIDVRSAS